MASYTPEVLREAAALTLTEIAALITEKARLQAIIAAQGRVNVDYGD